MALRILPQKSPIASNLPLVFLSRCRLAAVIASVSVLAACGGGSSDDSDDVVALELSLNPTLTDDSSVIEEISYAGAGTAIELNQYLSSTLDDNATTSSGRSAIVNFTPTESGWVYIAMEADSGTDFDLLIENISTVSAMAYGTGVEGSSDEETLMQVTAGNVYQLGVYPGNNESGSFTLTVAGLGREHLGMSDDEYLVYEETSYESTCTLSSTGGEYVSSGTEGGLVFIDFSDGSVSVVGDTSDREYTLTSSGSDSYTIAYSDRYSLDSTTLTVDGEMVYTIDSDRSSATGAGTATSVTSYSGGDLTNTCEQTNTSEVEYLL